jgi:hypothetical protein
MLELLTYRVLAERLNITPDAARSFARRHRLPRSRSNDGRALVGIDLDEVRHQPVSPGRPEVDQRTTAVLEAKVETLQAKVEMLQAEIAGLEAAAAGHRADFERERDRAEKLMAELLKATADLMAAKADTATAREASARLEGELTAIRARPWWRRLLA